MKVRQLQTSVWDDGYFMSLNDKERLAFFLLIHNQALTMTGIYELPVELMRFRLRASDVEVNQIRSKFENDGKFFFYQSWVYVANWARHNTFSSLETVMKKFAADFNKIPAAVRKYFIEVKNLKYELPFQTEAIALEGITVTVKGNGNGNGGIDRLSIGYGKEYVDPDSIPDLGGLDNKIKKDRMRVSGFAVILLMAIFGLFCIKPIHAITIERKVIISTSYSTPQDSVKLKSPVKPQIKATQTRFKRSKANAGVGLPKPSDSVANPTPAPVYAELPEFKKEVARKIAQEFPAHAREMIAIAMAESGLRCEAINHTDSNGVQAVGLFQINDGRWFSEQDIVNLMDCNHNIERAKQKYQSNKLAPWGAYWNGAYQRYLWIFDEI